MVRISGFLIDLSWLQGGALGSRSSLLREGSRERKASYQEGTCALNMCRSSRHSVRRAHCNGLCLKSCDVSSFLFCGGNSSF